MLNGVFAENERRQAFVKKYSIVIATNLTSIGGVYKEKLVKKLLIPKHVASIQIQKVAIFDTDRLKINLIPNNLLNRKLNVDIENGLNLDYKQVCIDPYVKTEIIFIFTKFTHPSQKLQKPLKLSFLDLQS